MTNEASKPAHHFGAWLGDPKQVADPVQGLHVFEPDHNLYCNACGYGELQGDHGMIPGDGAANGTDFSPQFRDNEVRLMYAEARGGLSELAEE